MRISNLLLLAFSIVICIIISDSAQGVGFSFSPSELRLDSSAKCADVKVFSDRPLNLKIGERWSDIRSRDIRDYTLEEDYLFHPEYVPISKEETIGICLKGKPSTPEYGLLVLDAINTSFSGGVWVEIARSSERNDSSEGSRGFSPSGFILLEPDNLNKNISSTIIVLLIEIAIILTCLLCLLAAIFIRKKKSD